MYGSLVSGWRRRFQQASLFHNHHEWIGRVRRPLSLKIQANAFFRDQLRRNGVLEIESDVRFLSRDVVGASGDLELRWSRLKDHAIHLNSLALDGVPDSVLIFLRTVGENEL